MFCSIIGVCSHVVFLFLFLFLFLFFLFLFFFLGWLTIVVRSDGWTYVIACAQVGLAWNAACDVDSSAAMFDCRGQARIVVHNMCVWPDLPRLVAP